MKHLAYTLTLLSALCALPTNAKRTSTPSQAQAPTLPAAQAHAPQKQPLQEKIVMQLDKPGYVTGDTIRFHAALLDADTGQPLRDFSRYLYVELIDPFGQTVSRVKIKERDGQFPGIIPLDRDLPESRYTLGAYTMFMQNIPSSYFLRQPVDIASVYGINHRIHTSLEGNTLQASITDLRTGQRVECRVISVSGPDKDKEPLRVVTNRTSVKAKIPADIPIVKVTLDHYSKFIPIPAAASDSHIQLHPEGGALVAGTVNAVAFRVVDPFSRWLQAQGHIETADGQHIADLSTGHSGYGLFHINPEEGATYYAVIGDLRTPLPAASLANTILQIPAVHKDHLLITPAGPVAPGSRIHIQRSGETLLDIATDGSPLSINREQLGQGLLKITLISPESQELSTRLVYNPPKDASQLPEALRLLTQDLAEPVDDITYYAQSAAAMLQLDAMLIANRSERYEPQAELRYPVEIGGEISGVIRSRWKGKPIEGATINVIAPAINFGMEATTDSEGRFYVNGFDWPDGTAFICQALGKKGQQEHNFTVTTDEFPEIQPLPLRPEIIREDPFEVIYADYHSDGTMLDELVVTAKADDEEVRQVMMRALGVRSMDAEELRSRGITTYEEAIYNIPQVTIRNGSIVSTRPGSIRNPHPPVEIWIDGTRISTPAPRSGTVDESYIMLSKVRKAGRITHYGSRSIPTAFPDLTATVKDLDSRLPFHDVATIEFVPPQLALYLSGNGAYNGGALVITSKTGKQGHWSNDIFKQVHIPLGYQREPSALRPWPTTSAR